MRHISAAMLLMALGIIGTGYALAIWLKDHNVTCLVLKYRTFVAADKSPANTWQNYQRVVGADGRRAIRILRKKAPELDLQSDKIGI